LADRVIKPASLKKGDKVGIIAPASSFSREGFAAGCDRLRQMGYAPVFSNGIFDRDLYFAGTWERRLRELEELIARDDIAALVCVRGGYGSNYLLEHLDFEGFIQHPKILVGCSDITSLLTAITDLGLAAVRVGHFSGDDASIIDLCRTAALTVLGDSEQRDVDWMLIISPPSPETGRPSARFAYEDGRPSKERDHWLDVPIPSILEGAIVLNLTKIFKPLRSILEVVRPEPPDFPYFRLKALSEDNHGQHP